MLGNTGVGVGIQGGKGGGGHTFHQFKGYLRNLLVVDTLLQTKESYEANDPFGTNALSATTESSGTNELTEMNEQFQTNSPSDEQMNIGQEHNIEGKGVYDALGLNKQLKK